MDIDATRIAGVYVCRLQPVRDERGTFVRTFCADEFCLAGLDPVVVQCGVSSNPLRGTLRGMHLQSPPNAETKHIRCTRGAIFDVAADMRRDSPTFGEWLGFELDEFDDVAIVLEPGIAHGFVTLTDAAEVSYQISTAFRADAAVGFRWDDPNVGIEWPMKPIVISERDRELPFLADVELRNM